MKGLLIYPEFPASSFWSYRHLVRMVGAKATFPPLGLLTFAALMPEDWELELIDLNVHRPADAELRDRIAAADAVFVSAMSIQKRSLVDLLAGPARGLDTPWVLGGPYPSSFRKQILEPKTRSDEILCRAREGALRAQSGRRLDEIAAWAAGLAERVGARTGTADDVRSLYRWSREYFIRQQRYIASLARIS